jgi:hypothetical protein
MRDGEKIKQTWRWARVKQAEGVEDVGNIFLVINVKKPLQNGTRQPGRRRQTVTGVIMKADGG